MVDYSKMAVHMTADDYDPSTQYDAVLTEEALREQAEEKIKASAKPVPKPAAPAAKAPAAAPAQNAPKQEAPKPVSPAAPKPEAPKSEEAAPQAPKKTAMDIMREAKEAAAKKNNDNVKGDEK